MATQVKTGLIANDAITDAKIANVALTGVTASSGDSSTSLATTAFVTGEINSLIDSAPGALNTLNELAAALGDDANFSTTVTNSIATKLPLAGGTLTGALTINHANGLTVHDTNGTSSNRLKFLYNGTSGVATLGPDSSSGNTSLAIGTSSATAGFATALTLDSNRNATFSGSITATGLNSTAGTVQFTDGGSTFDSSDSNGYSHFTQMNGSAQIGFSRTGGSTGTGYIGADSNFVLNVYNGSFAKKASISTSGDAAFTGSVSADGNISLGGADGDDAVLSLTANTGNWVFTNVQSNRNLEISDSDGTGKVLTIDTSGQVGIGTDNPDNTLHIHKASAGTVQGNTNSPLTVENDTNNYIQMLSPDSTESGILFGNPTNTASVGIVAHGSAGAGGMDFRVGGNQSYMQLKSDGYLQIHNNRGEYGLELRSTSNRSGLVIKKPGTSSIDGSALVLSNGTFRLGTANDYHMYMYSSGNSAGVTAGYNIIGPDADHLTGMGILPTHGKLEVQGSAHDAAVVVSNDDLSGSTGGIGFDGRGGRYLTSNGTSWDSDGKDPGLVIGSNHSTANTRKNLGIVLHNESNADNVMSPGIFFGSRSTSGSYNTAYAYIMGKTKTSGADSNWKTGEIHMDTAGQHNGLGGSATYLGNNPAFRMSQGGVLHFPNQAHAYGHFTSSNTTMNTGWGMSVESNQGTTYTNHGTHGLGITVMEEGYYGMWATGLYQYTGSPGTYVYVGWAINGAQNHHWHSNHTVENNHDFVSLVFAYLSAGDHITMENSSSAMASQWGGNHSFFSIWKVG